MGPSSGYGDPRLSEIASAVARDSNLRQELDQMRADATLRSIAESGPRSPQFTYSRQRLTKFAYLLRIHELQRPPRERRSQPHLLTDVATAFEDLARLAQEDTSQRIELLGQASAMWSLAGYQANSVVLAREVLGLVAGNQALSARFLRLAATILERNPTAIALRAQTELAQIPEIETAILDPNGDSESIIADAVFLAAHGIMAQGALDAVQFWRTGSDDSANRAVARLEHASEICSQTGIVDASLLLANVALVLSDAFSLSLWRRVRGNIDTWNGIWRRHVSRLAMNTPNVVELWPAQLRAVEAGFLRTNQSTIAVRMPTSAGKTRLAELAILSAVSVEPGKSLAAYIVPTRALAGEIESRLNQSLGRDGIRVSALFGGYDHAEYEASVLSSVDVLVATPEKLDMLLRRQPDIVDRLNLTIIDEAHLIDDRDRGAGCEILITRLRRKVPQARLFLLSAVMSNVQEIGNWLDPLASGGNVVEDEWTPSRLSIGTFEWSGPNVEGQTGTINYYRPQHFFVPYVLERHRLTKKLYPRNLTETTAELALHFQSLGPVLVGVSTKPSAVGVARDIQGAIQRHARSGREIVIEADIAQLAARERLAELIQNTIGESHILAQYVRIGIAFHNADLPNAIRIEIEEAYRDGALKILCATSTLSQGVNLPARTVLVGNVMRGEFEQISVREFRNLAGRAGRAFVETEGQVVIVAERPQRASWLANHYILGSDPEPVEGELFRLVSKLVELRGQSLTSDIDGDENSLRLQRALSRLDSQLLALMIEELVDTEDELEISDLLQETLCAIQLSKLGIPLELAEQAIRNRMMAVIAQVPDAQFRQSFYRTGLRISSCEFIYSQLSTLVADDPLLFSEEEWALDLLIELCRIGVHVAEFRESEFSSLPYEQLEAILLGWTSGDSIDAIFDALSGTPGITTHMELSRCIETAITRDLAWIISASTEIMTLCLDDDWSANPTITAFPTMVRFGVDSIGATYACSLGVSNRRTAIQLGDAFLQVGGGTFFDFIAWITSLGRNGLEELADPNDIHRILDRTATFSATARCLEFIASGGDTSLTTALRGVQLEPTERITVGDLLSIEVGLVSQFDLSNVSVHRPDGSMIGHVPHTLAKYVAAVLEDGISLGAKVDYVTVGGFQARVMVTIGRFSGTAGHSQS